MKTKIQEKKGVLLEQRSRQKDGGVQLCRTAVIQGWAGHVQRLHNPGCRSLLGCLTDGQLGAQLLRCQTLEQGSKGSGDGSRRKHDTETG